MPDRSSNSQSHVEWGATWTFLSVLLVSLPVMVYLYARYDEHATTLFLLLMLFFCACVIVAVWLAMRSLKHKNFRRHLLAFALLFGLSLYFVSSGHPFKLGRDAKFFALEDQLNRFVETVRIDSLGESEPLVVSDELANRGILAFGKRYEDEAVRIYISTGGAGGFVYVSKDSDLVQDELQAEYPNRWPVAEHWAVYNR